ncbi:MAG: hypothetical protein GX638_14890 [Crenarchaeota archaeon]|nr:hypothetical protein [Thermoproteota archaeon]
MKLDKLERLKRFREQILIKFDWEWYFLNNAEYHGGLGRELNYLANKAFDELLDAEIERQRGKMTVEDFRWRDPEKELPGHQQQILVNRKKGSLVVCVLKKYLDWQSDSETIEWLVQDGSPLSPNEIVGWLPIPEPEKLLKRVKYGADGKSYTVE